MVRNRPAVSLQQIERQILFVRGHKVMLDSDLASLYEVDTRVLNQAVKRNIDRFPEDFMFSLTRDEIERISQSVTSSNRYKTLCPRAARRMSPDAPARRIRGPSYYGRRKGGGKTFLAVVAASGFEPLTKGL